MKFWGLLVFILLVSSLSLNLYLLSSSKSPLPQETLHPLSQNAVPTPVKPSTDDEMPKPSLLKAQVQQTLGDQTSSLNRAQLLEQANHWLTDKNLLALETFLQRYLKQHPQDMDFLLIEAQLKVETGLLSDAISHYYDLLRMPMTVYHKNIIQQQIKGLTSATIEQLTNNYSWDILAIFVEPLLQLEPTNRLYILSLATAYAELAQEGLMENVLASLTYDDPAAQKIRQILVSQQTAMTSQEDASEAEMTPLFTRSIPLKQMGDHYLVNGRLSSNPVTLLIDTGASITAISREYFNNLSNRYKVNYLGRFNISTAGGRVMAPMYQFRELTIQHVSLEDLAVIIIPMQGLEHAEGLLGMNFLREFDFKIDQAHSVLFLN